MYVILCRELSNDFELTMGQAFYLMVSKRKSGFSWLNFPINNGLPVYATAFLAS
jgi:hypothetical protein